MVYFRKAQFAAAMFAADAIAQGLVVGTAAKWLSVALHALTVAGVWRVSNVPKETR